jgi:hypothetical protein
MGSGGIAQPLLISELDGDKWSVSRPGCFNLGERAPGTHWKRGWVGIRASLDALEWKHLLPLVEIDPWLSSL